MKQKMYIDSVLWIAIATGILSTSLPSLVMAAQKTDTAQALTQEAWRKAITNKKMPGTGCFKASYPHMEWNKVRCTEAPHIPFRPRSGRSGPMAGNGADYAAYVSSGLIRQSIGTFPVVQGVKTETGINGQNSYSLQLNSNFMRTQICNGAADPANCLSWQQFVYASDYQGIFMQYWLINWNNTCPSGWYSYGGDCYTNSESAFVPKQAISQLKNLVIFGSANEGGLDVLIMLAGSNAYGVTGEDSVVDLATAWSGSEFNIIGDGDGSQATFNTGSTIAVNVAVINGTKNAPICASNAGTTGETNNLLLGSCLAKGGTMPNIQFTESN